MEYFKGSRVVMVLSVFEVGLFLEADLALFVKDLIGMVILRYNIYVVYSSRLSS